MRKINLSIMTMFLAALILATASCRKKEEVDPEHATTEESMQVKAIVYAYTIKASESMVDGSQLNLPPGSFIAIESGTRGPLYLKNFKGLPGQPITFINHSSGKTILKGSGSWTLKVGNCKDIRITGSGSSDTYGILVDGGHNAVTLPELTTDFEIDHIEVKNAGFAGIMGKTDPNCDSKTWRENFLMTDVSLHDNYIHDVKGEGFYIGYSFYNGRSESCGTVYPHEIHGLRIYKNIIKNSGCEGIQVGCAAKDCEIFDNYIENYGTDPFAAYQNNGLQIGAGTAGKCYNNIIRKGPGNGMQVFGTGGNLIYNNVIADAGSIGIFCDERTAPTEGFIFINNTIVNTGSDGMRLYSEQVPMNTIINNIIVNPKSGKYVNTTSGVKLNEKNNYYSMDISSVKFVNYAEGNYTLNQGSPAVNTGWDVSSYGITHDLLKATRPSGGVFDIGAYEYGGTVISDPVSAPAPAPAPDPSSPISGLTLINADTDKDISGLTHGQEINFAIIGTTKLNVRANPAASTGSVVFMLDGKIFRTESYAPYALAGDGSGGNYYAWTPSLGRHTLIVTPYSLAGGKGTAGMPLTVEFTVVNSLVSNPVPTPIPSTTVKFLAAEDAYLDRGIRYNNSYLRVENGRRVTYLKFNVSSVTSFSSAKLRLKCDGDEGYGTVKVSTGSHNNWTENTITSNSAPGVSSTIAFQKNTFQKGKVYEFDLSSAIKSNGTYTIIITMDSGGNDMSFGSSEGSSGPELIIN